MKFVVGSFLLNALPVKVDVVETPGLRVAIPAGPYGGVMK